MNATTRLILLIIVNLLMSGGMIYWLSESGVDITHSTLMDNANDASFAIIYMGFLLISFIANLLIIAYPSKKLKTMQNLVNNLNISTPKANRKHA